MKYFVGIMFAVCLIAQPAWAGIEMGQVPKEVVLKGDLGGKTGRESMEQQRAEREDPCDLLCRS